MAVLTCAWAAPAWAKAEKPAKNVAAKSVALSPKAMEAYALAEQKQKAQVAKDLYDYYRRNANYALVQKHVNQAAKVYKVDKDLINAIITKESGFNQTAVSPVGAQGLMQIMPATAERFGVQTDERGTVEIKLADPRTNIMTGTRYLRVLLDMFPRQLELVIASYNAGEGAVRKYGNKIPNYKETQDYVVRVLEAYDALKTSPLFESGRLYVKQRKIDESKFASNYDAISIEGRLTAALKAAKEEMNDFVGGNYANGSAAFAARGFGAPVGGAYGRGNLPNVVAHVRSKEERAAEAKEAKAAHALLAMAKTQTRMDELTAASAFAATPEVTNVVNKTTIKTEAKVNANVNANTKSPAEQTAQINPAETSLTSVTPATPTE